MFIGIRFITGSVLGGFEISVDGFLHRKRLLFFQPLQHHATGEGDHAYYPPFAGNFTRLSTRRSVCNSCGNRQRFCSGRHYTGSDLVVPEEAVIPSGTDSEASQLSVDTRC